jgi:sugar phosphate permease
VLVNKTSRWKARHTVLSILFITWIVSTMDRMAMSVAIPYIAADFHLGAVASGLVMSAFYAGYATSQVPGGLLADRFGVRRVATLAMLWWSAFTAMTGAVTHLVQMLIVRFVFGLGEGMFPACALKTIAVWFPKKERATANAIMLASNPLGVALAPLAVVGIMSFGGWRSVFYSLFLPGLLVSLCFWIFIPDRPAQSHRVSPEELVEIEDGAAQDSQAKPTLLCVLQQPGVLKYFCVLFTFDIAFWGFTAWLPTYLVQARGFSMLQMGVAASLPYFAGTVGSVLGGWVSDSYFSNNRRMPIVLSQLLAALFLYLTFTAGTAGMLVVWQTLTGFFFLSVFSAFWALPMNTVPRSLMGVAGGFINMAGQAAAFVSPLLVGYLVGAAGGSFDHTFMFLIAALLVSSTIALTLPGKMQRAPVARPAHIQR